METTPSGQKYPDHQHTLMRRTDAALAACGYDHLLIAAGVEKLSFLDDRPYPFRANPHFKAWLPLTAHPHCWLAYTPGQRPRLAYYQPEDYWHLPPAAPTGEWVEHFDIRIVRSPEQAAELAPRGGRCAILGEADAALPGLVPNNPPALLARLHYDRACKTGYELDCLRAASKRAVRGHLAAAAAFAAGGSEREIHLAYLAASGHGEDDLPYGNIVGLNEHGAVLHYQHRRADKPQAHRSLLIDAGADHHGYAADITRTYGNGDPHFEALVRAVDAEQQALAAQVRPGADYRDLHRQAHRRLAGVLQALGIVRMDPERQVAEGVSAAFFPHGLGHLLGLQVHDVGGLQAGPEGGEIPRPEGHPYLRLTRVLQPGMVVTIEPGLYFIDSLLARLRAGPHAAHIDWTLVEHLRAFGGVRIEDDVTCTDDAPENLTRDAFAAAG